jgi:hypothetical protein
MKKQIEFKNFKISYSQNEKHNHKYEKTESNQFLFTKFN